MYVLLVFICAPGLCMCALGLYIGSWVVYVLLGCVCVPVLCMGSWFVYVLLVCVCAPGLCNVYVLLGCVCAPGFCMCYLVVYMFLGRVCAPGLCMCSWVVRTSLKMSKETSKNQVRRLAKIVKGKHPKFILEKEIFTESLPELGKNQPNFS